MLVNKKRWHILQPEFLHFLLFISACISSVTTGKLHWVPMLTSPVIQSMLSLASSLWLSLSSTGHTQPNKPVKHQFFFPNWCQFILDNLLQELKAKRCRFDPWVMKITWSGTLVPSDSCDPMDCSLPGLSLHGISQARILEWVAISFSRGSSRPRNWTRVSRSVGRRFTVWASRGATRRDIKEQLDLPSGRAGYRASWPSTGVADI